MVFGNDLPLSAPAALAGPVELLPGLQYPAYRLLIIGVGLALAAAAVAAGAEDAAWARWCAPAPRTARWRTAMGVDIPRLFTVVFGIGAGAVRRRRRAARAAARGAGRHGREHPDPRLRRHRHRRHRLDPRRARRRAARRRRRHARPHVPAARCCASRCRRSGRAPPGRRSPRSPIYVFMAVVLAVRPQGLFPARG